MRRVLIVIGVIALGIGGGVAAGYAQSASGTSHILGSPGPIVLFDRDCHRTVISHPVPPKVKFNVLAQQIKCVVRRRDPFAVCVRRLGPPPVPVARFDHGVGNPGDWLGVDKMAAYQRGIWRCSFARLATLR